MARSNAQLSSIHIVAAIAIIVMAAQSCNLPIFNQSYGSVTLTIGSATDEAVPTSSRSGGPRTVLPTIAPATYLIEFTSTGTATASPMTTPTNSVQKLLRPGDWTIHVVARNEAVEPIAEGTSELFTVVSGQPVSVSVTLQALSAGTGGIDITLTWPAPSATVPEVTGYAVERDGTAVVAGAITAQLAATPPTLHYLEELPVGSYRIVVRLLYGTSARYVYDEAVQVVGNSTSAFSKSLTAEHFTLEPNPPTNPLAVETSTGITLSWTDASDIETRYTIVRTSVGTTLSHTVARNSTSWLDTSAETGTAYTYTVSAGNDTGESTAVSVAGLKALPVPGNAGAIVVGETTAESVVLSWTAASDNHSLPAALIYQVYQDDVATGAATAGMTGYTVTGLTELTEYTFNVRVTDEVNLTATYQPVTVTTEPIPGTVTVTIGLIQPGELPMTLNITQGQVITTGGTFTVTLTETYADRTWYLDGVSIGTGQSVDLDCTALDPGAHRLSLFVSQGGKLYSTSVDFRIQF